MVSLVNGFAPFLPELPRTGIAPFGEDAEARLVLVCLGGFLAGGVVLVLRALAMAS